MLMIKTNTVEIELTAGGSVYANTVAADLFSQWNDLKPESAPRIKEIMSQIKELSGRLSDEIMSAVDDSFEDTVLTYKTAIA